jgi:hypothetical protein
MKKMLHLIIVVGGLMLIPTGIEASCWNDGSEVYCSNANECMVKRCSGATHRVYNYNSDRCECKTSPLKKRHYTTPPL